MKLETSHFTIGIRKGRLSYEGMLERIKSKGPPSKISFANTAEETKPGEQRTRQLTGAEVLKVWRAVLKA